MSEQHVSRGHYAVLILFVAVVSFISIKAGSPELPDMPGVTNPPPPEVLAPEPVVSGKLLAPKSSAASEPSGETVAAEPSANAPTTEGPAPVNPAVDSQTPAPAAQSEEWN